MLERDITHMVILKNISEQLYQMDFEYEVFDVNVYRMMNTLMVI